MYACFAIEGFERVADCDHIHLVEVTDEVLRSLWGQRNIALLKETSCRLLIVLDGLSVGKRGFGHKEIHFVPFRQKKLS
jgi:hypothetical protein